MHIAAVDGTVQGRERTPLERLADSLTLTDTDVASVWLEAAESFSLDEA